MKNQALCVKIRQFAPRITKILKRFAEFHLLSVDVEGTLVPEIIFGAFKISFEAFENSVFDNDTSTELIRAQQITVCIEQKFAFNSPETLLFASRSYYQTHDFVFILTIVPKKIMINKCFILIYMNTFDNYPK